MTRLKGYTPRRPQRRTLQKALLTTATDRPILLGMRSSTRAALRDVLRRAPGSIRELAAAAGITDAALRQARDGQTNLTDERVRGVVKALRRWSATTAKLADRLEATLEDPGEGGSRG